MTYFPLVFYGNSQKVIETQSCIFHLLSAYRWVESCHCGGVVVFLSCFLLYLCIRVQCLCVGGCVRAWGCRHRRIAMPLWRAAADVTLQIECNPISSSPLNLIGLSAMKCRKRDLKNEINDRDLSLRNDASYTHTPTLHTPTLHTPTLVAFRVRSNLFDRIEAK